MKFYGSSISEPTGASSRNLTVLNRVAEDRCAVPVVLAAATDLTNEFSGEKRIATPDEPGYSEELQYSRVTGPIG